MDVRRKARGRAGESSAAEFLEAQGYRIVARNHHSRAGEVDLIAERGELLCFVEVRARAGSAIAAPEATVTRGKQRKVVLAALDYVQRHELTERAIRFDVVAILGDDILHIENAFDAGM
ncbi:MAG: YraN family protein [Deltaproteobacteria bacterium]|nr:YraN family protein [Deltaproteobacteria bacterium]